MQKKILIITSIVIMILSAFALNASAETYEGTCGDNVSWSLSDGTLTISGSGDMNFERFSWSEHSKEICSVVIGDGITSIGNNAFADCVELKDITIPDSVKTISNGAFRNCVKLADITIPDSVTQIGDYAFDSCSSLTNVKIGGGVFKIGECAFYGCEGLTEITIPDSVTQIGNGAFDSCTGLRSIKIPDGVKNISVCTFARCSSLVSVEMGDGITEIGENAFCDCVSLESIAIPDSVKNIGSSAFGSCRNMTEIEMNKWLTNIGDYAFSGCGSLTTIVIPDNVTSIGTEAFADCSSLASVEIGNNVTNIGDRAFYKCTGLTKVKWNAKSVADLSYDNNIFYGAGENADGINVIFDSGVRRIPAYVLYTSWGGSSNVTHLSIGINVAEIGEKAFYDCAKLEQINWNAMSVSNFSEANEIFFNLGNATDGTSVVFGDSVWFIPANIFHNYSGNDYNITDITLGKEVSGIGGNAFYSCRGIERINWNSKKYSPKFCIFSNLGNEKIVSVVFGDDVEAIPASAFSGCNALTSLTIGKKVASIGNYAFNGCNRLTSITIPDSVTSIGNYAFSECTGLTSVTMGKGIRTIGEGAFYECAYLTDITIPEGVESIGKQAFYNCGGLTQINWNAKSVADFASNSSIFYSAGMDGAGVSVIFGDSVEKIPAYIFSNASTYINEITIGKNVITIGDRAFGDCTKLTSITIPENVTNIGDYAFYGCTGLTQINWNAKNVEDFLISNYIFCAAGQNGSGISVIFGDNVESIPAYIFYSSNTYNQPNIKSITFGENIEEIGSYAFYNCTGLTQINWNAKRVSDFTSKNYIFYNAGRKGNGINLIFGDSVESIPAYAFWANSDLTPYITRVEIGSGVKIIGTDVFCNCISIAGVYIKSIKDWCNINFGYYTSNPLYYSNKLYLNNQLVTDAVISDEITSVPAYAFYDYDELKRVIINGGVTSVGNYAFYRCGNLADITIPDSVVSIGRGAFCYCESLTDVIIPDSVTSIGEYAFYDCSKIANLSIGSGVNYIGGYAFGYCTGLTSVTIPDSVTSIGSAAFSSCYNLADVKIGDKVEIIGDNAFYYCESLTNIIIPDSVTNIGGAAFSSCHSLANVKIGDGVEIIEDNAFYDCRNLTGITIPDGVTSIGTNAFYGCSATVYVHAEDISLMGNSGISTAKIVCYHIVTYKKGGEIYATEYVNNGEDAILPDAGVDYMVNNEYWTGENITEDVTVNIVSASEVTYAGDYIGKETIRYGQNTTLPVCGEEGYHFEFFADGKEWDGENIISNVTVTVKKVINTYTITYTGDYSGEDNAEHGQNVTLPVCEEEGYHYEFFVNGAEWNGENITSNVSVTVEKIINTYIVEYIGAYYGQVLVTYAANAILPTASFGYHYVFTVDGREWTGENITSDVEVTVTRVKNTYTITYTGDYSGKDNAEHGGNVTLPTAPSGYAYSFTINGTKWSGKNITSDVIVTVSLLNDTCELVSGGSLYNVTKSGSVYTASSYRAYLSVLNGDFALSEGASCVLYSNSACTKEIEKLSIINDGVTTCYIKIKAESGRTKVYTLNLTKLTLDTLGGLTHKSSAGALVTVEPKNAIIGNPFNVTIFYSDKTGEIYRSAETVYLPSANQAYAHLPYEDAEYWVKLAADYGDGDENLVYSQPVLVKTGITLSDKCDILSVHNMPNAEIDIQARTITGSVGNFNEEWRVSVQVSAGATWAVYRTETAQVPISNNTISLREGRTVSVYVRVTAEDGYTQKNYCMTIYRQTKSEKPIITYKDGMVTITATEGSKICYTTNNDEPTPADTVYTGPFNASVGTVIKAIALDPKCDEYSDSALFIIEESISAKINELYFDKASGCYEWGVYIESGDELDATLFVALYNNQDVLVGLQVVEIEGAEAYEEGEIVASSDVAYHKIFLWENGALIPLCENI